MGYANDRKPTVMGALGAVVAALLMALLVLLLTWACVAVAGQIAAAVAM